jgi:hypothetical protein
MPFRSIAVFAGLCLLVPAGYAAPAKPAVQKAAPKPVKKLPTGSSAKKSEEPPPGVRVQPQPGQTAAKPAKPAPAKKAAAKPSKKKKHTASKKESVKSGRAAASSSPMDGVDKNQLAVDHLKNAAAKSPLDLLSSYKEVLRDGDLETAAVLLRLAANEEPSHQLVTRVNDMLGVALDTQDTQALLEIARARRADTVIENGAEKRPDDAVASPVGSRIHAAHQAVADAPRRSRLDALAIYKRAVTEHNPEAAALALSGIAQGPVDVALVTQTNELLGLEDAIIPAEQIAGQAAAPQ